jgi:hypothetical protein
MRRKLIVGALGAAALAASVSAFTSTASAMPIRGVTTGTQGSTFYVAAAAYSPATADGCGGYYGVGLYSGGTRVRERFGRFNACRYNVRGGVTYG